MKKLILLALSVLMVIFPLTACGETNGTIATTMACVHDYASVVTKEPTYDEEGEMTYTCNKCSSAYTETIAKLERHVVPTEILDSTVSKIKYQVPPFSISLGELVNSAVDNYRLKHYTGEEAISNGYLTIDQIYNGVDINNVYVSIISGDTMVNPDMPYMTEYEEEAVKVWMIFDENDNLLSHGLEVCENLETCAILIMTSGF